MGRGSQAVGAHGVGGSPRRGWPPRPAEGPRCCCGTAAPLKVASRTMVALPGEPRGPKGPSKPWATSGLNATLWNTASRGSWYPTPSPKKVMAASDSSIVRKIDLVNWGQSASKLFLAATKLSREQKRTLNLAFPLAVDHQGQVLLGGKEAWQVPWNTDKDPIPLVRHQFNSPVSARRKGAEAASDVRQWLHRSSSQTDLCSQGDRPRWVTAPLEPPCKLSLLIPRNHLGEQALFPFYRFYTPWGDAGGCSSSGWWKQHAPLWQRNDEND